MTWRALVGRAFVGGLVMIPIAIALGAEWPKLPLALPIGATSYVAMYMHYRTDWWDWWGRKRRR